MRGLKEREQIAKLGVSPSLGYSATEKAHGISSTTRAKCNQIRGKQLAECFVWEMGQRAGRKVDKRDPDPHGS